MLQAEAIVGDIEVFHNIHYAMITGIAGVKGLVPNWARWQPDLEPVPVLGEPVGFCKGCVYCRLDLGGCSGLCPEYTYLTGRGESVGGKVSVQAIVYRHDLKPDNSNKPSLPPGAACGRLSGTSTSLQLTLVGPNSL